MKLICGQTCAEDECLVKGKGWTLLTTVVLLFMPKCAFCWAAYLSLFGSIGLVIKYQPWFLPAMIALFLVTLVKSLFQAVRRKNFVAFGLAMAAGLLILSQRDVAGINTAKIFAMILMAAAVLMDNLLQTYKTWMHARGRKPAAGSFSRFARLFKFDQVFR